MEAAVNRLPRKKGKYPQKAKKEILLAKRASLCYNQ
jgi:hypothetical protein